MRVCTGVLIAGLLVAAVSVEAKEFRYSSGPVPPDDTTLSVAEAELEPVVSSRGPNTLLRPCSSTNPNHSPSQEKKTRHAPPVPGIATASV